MSLVNLDAGLLDQPGRVLLGPGTEVGRQVARGDLLDLGGEPVQDGVQVSLADRHPLTVDHDHVVGHVHQGRLRGLAGVEAVQGAVIAPQGGLDGRPGPVPVPPSCSQEAVVTLGGGVRGAVGHQGQRQGQAQGADQDVGPRSLGHEVAQELSPQLVAGGHDVGQGGAYAVQGHGLTGDRGGQGHPWCWRQTRAGLHRGAGTTGTRLFPGDGHREQTCAQSHSRRLHPHLGIRSWRVGVCPHVLSRDPPPGHPELADLGHAHRGLRPTPESAGSWPLVGAPGRVAHSFYNQRSTNGLIAGIRQAARGPETRMNVQRRPSCTFILPTSASRAEKPLE